MATEISITITITEKRTTIMATTLPLKGLSRETIRKYETLNLKWHQYLQ